MTVDELLARMAMTIATLQAEFATLRLLIEKEIRETEVANNDLKTGDLQKHTGDGIPR